MFSQTPDFDRRINGKELEIVRSKSHCQTSRTILRIARTLRSSFLMHNGCYHKHLAVLLEHTEELAIVTAPHGSVDGRFASWMIVTHVYKKPINEFHDHLKS